MRLSSDQDYNAELAGYSAQILRIHAAFPELGGNNRSANSDLEQKFAERLHSAMGWRRDHQDRD